MAMVCMSSSLLQQGADGLFQVYFRHTGMAAATAAGTEHPTVPHHRIAEFAVETMALAVKALCTKALATSDLGKTFMLTGVPDPQPSPGGRVEFRLIYNIEAITGRTDVGAVAAGETLFTNLCPDMTGF